MTGRTTAALVFNGPFQTAFWCDRVRSIVDDVTCRNIRNLAREVNPIKAVTSI